MRKWVCLCTLVLGLLAAAAFACAADPSDQEALAQINKRIKSLEEEAKELEGQGDLLAAAIRSGFAIGGKGGKEAFGSLGPLIALNKLDALDAKLDDVWDDLVWLRRVRDVYEAALRLNDRALLDKLHEIMSLESKREALYAGILTLTPGEREQRYKKIDAIDWRQAWMLRDLESQLRAILDANKGGGGGGCFAAVTLVLMADGSFRPIETLRPGDLVLSRSFDCGTDVPARIGEVSSGVDAFVFSINEGLRPNAAHRFYTASRPKSAAELEPGDVLVGRDGPAPVVSKERVGPALAARGRAVPGVTVYNILVEGTHTFYVSADGQATYLVHDQGACGR